MASELRSLSWLKTLISYNTVSCRSNIDLINDCKNHLQKLGFTCKLFFNEEKTKANIYASIGPTHVPGIILSGHTDVVPVSGQKWNTNPFELIESGDKLYGRGTCDMKGFIAVCMAYADAFSNAKLTMPIHFAFSYDEEPGCTGVGDMTDYISQLSLKPKYCFVGEPTMMSIVKKHKGKQTIRCEVKGSECHSSLIHQGVNAVEFAAELISKIRAMKINRLKEGPFDRDFNPPVSSVHCGVVQGGEACNIMPKHCYFFAEWRFIPSEKPEDIYEEIVNYAKELEKEMKETIPDSGFEFITEASFLSLNTPADSEVVSLGKQLSTSNILENVSYGTEAAFFSAAGVPSVVIGPGSIEQAHKPNEYILIDQMKQCETFMENLLAYVQQ